MNARIGERSSKAHATKLKAERHTIIPAKGKPPPRVADFENALV